MKRYNPKEIEPKWQKIWKEAGLYKAVDFDKRPKFVMLTEFPYPSGAAMHLGHVREYTLGDIVARYKKRQGFNVLYPMGYDEFGLPTENYAIKNNITPQKATEENVASFQGQLERLGYGIDWSRKVRTSDPEFYKWTQWLFLQFFKAGLAYQDETTINWCPHCKTGLANEEVINGRHERCDTLVEKRMLKQWLLKITDYADRLIEGLQNVDYPSRIADQQINWIGKSQGAEIDFDIEDSKHKIRIFTTRPDTIYGATYMVLAPEHPLVHEITTSENKAHVNAYIKTAQSKTELERQENEKNKTGVPTGAHATNPVTGEKIPVWIADYVLMGYGTGAIMAVPAHDARDMEFAKKHNLPIRQVIAERLIHAENKHREGVEVIPRNVVIVVVKHPDDDKYLIVKPKGSDYWSPVMGGIDEGETAEQAAKRELAEESGYKNTKSLNVYPQIIASEFFAQHKNENRIAYCNIVAIELENVQHQEVSEEEKEKQELRWVSFDEAIKKCTGAGAKEAFDVAKGAELPMALEGRMINSGKYNDMLSHEAREKIVADLVKKGVAKEKTNYKLRDWIFSRQRYWGEPIPIIHCPNHGAVAVPDDQLPVKLPAVKDYEPTDNAESPLAAVEDWVNVECPVCGKPSKRETDTMPNWAGSSWYYLRYFDPHNKEAFADRKKLNYWGDVDMYLGGMEHTTLHLLYSRFWHQFFYDQGLVPTPEPYAARRGQGIILAADGSKMSKSKGNVVNPSEIIDDGYGADALRMAITFLAPFDQTTPWSPETVAGTFRFLQRVWTLVYEYLEASNGPKLNMDEAAITAAAHRAVKKVTTDLEKWDFNTAIAAQMSLTNELYKLKVEVGLSQTPAWRSAIETQLQLLAPFAPHITEELWRELGHEESVHINSWPSWNEDLIKEYMVTLAVQINGKVRAEILVDTDISEEDAIAAAKADEKVAAYVKDRKIKKAIYISGRIVSLVV